MSVQVGAKAATDAAASKKPSECITDCLHDLASTWSETRSFLLIAYHQAIIDATAIRFSKRKYEKRGNKSRSPLQSGDAGFLSSCCCFLKYALLLKRPSVTHRASKASPNFRHAWYVPCLTASGCAWIIWQGHRDSRRCMQRVSWHPCRMRPPAPPSWRPPGPTLRSRPSPPAS